ncbi:hypothetical protein [Klebsiella pneumoniae]
MTLEHSTGALTAFHVAMSLLAMASGPLWTSTAIGRSGRDAGRPRF